MNQHVDMDVLTILHQSNTRRGCLQVKISGSDVWQEVPSTDDSLLVIHIGEIFKFWCGGRVQSTLHRVVGAPPGEPRTSLAFFHQPPWDAKMKPLQQTEQSGRNVNYASLLDDDGTVPFTRLFESLNITKKDSSDKDSGSEDPIGHAS